MEAGSSNLGGEGEQAGVQQMPSKISVSEGESKYISAPRKKSNDAQAAGGGAKLVAATGLMLGALLAW